MITSPAYAAVQFPLDKPVKSLMMGCARAILSWVGPLAVLVIAVIAFAIANANKPRPPTL